MPPQELYVCTTVFLVVDDGVPVECFVCDHVQVHTIKHSTLCQCKLRRAGVVVISEEGVGIGGVVGVVGKSTCKIGTLRIRVVSSVQWRGDGLNGAAEGTPRP